MIRVTRYNPDGSVMHTCLTEPEVRVICDKGFLSVDMPWRFWFVPAGGKVEISYAE